MAGRIIIADDHPLLRAALLRAVGKVWPRKLSTLAAPRWQPSAGAAWKSGFARDLRLALRWRV